MASIKLLAPSNDSITAPLQRYPWAFDEEMPRGSIAGDGTPASAGDQTDPEAFRYLGGPLEGEDKPVTSEDRGLPRDISFVWEAYPGGEGAVSYDLMISQDPDFDDSLLLKDLSVPRAEMLRLHIATRYYWKVIARRSGQRVAESATWGFTTHSAPPRWIRVPGTTNVRDIGGWPLPDNRIVRQGAVYRGSELNGHIHITDEGERVLVHDLGIRTDLDLRGNTEEATPELDQNVVQWIHIPIVSYHSLLEQENQESLHQVLRVFAEASNYPILLHCWGGADRTGTIVFLLNALFGVSRANLIHDYELTSLSIWGERSRSYWKFNRLMDAFAPSGEGTDRFAEQVAAYLLSIGLTQEIIEAIRTQLVVDREDR